MVRRGNGGKEGAKRMACKDHTSLDEALALNRLKKRVKKSIKESTWRTSETERAQGANQTEDVERQDGLDLAILIWSQELQDSAA